MNIDSSTQGASIAQPVSTAAVSSAPSRAASSTQQDQFLRLLDGGSEEEVFPDESAEEEPAKPKADERRKRLPKPKPFPLPGQAMQPPDPEGAKG